MKKYYKKEPQGRERHNEIQNLKNTEFVPPKERAEYMGKCIQLYVANCCDIDKLKHRTYENNPEQEKNANAAMEGMESDNAILWNMLQMCHDSIQKDFAMSPTMPEELATVMWEISNLDEVVAKEINKRRPKSMTVIEELSVNSLLELAGKAINQAVGKIAEAEEAQSKEDEYFLALAVFIDLVEEGSTKDLLEYSRTIQETHFSDGYKKVMEGQVT